MFLGRGAFRGQRARCRGWHGEAWGGIKIALDVVVYLSYVSFGEGRRGVRREMTRSPTSLCYRLCVIAGCRSEGSGSGAVPCVSDGGGDSRTASTCCVFCVCLCAFVRVLCGFGLCVRQSRQWQEGKREAHVVIDPGQRKLLLGCRPFSLVVDTKVSVLFSMRATCAPSR